MERTPDGKVACVHVEGQGGRIWPRAPVPLPTGLLSILRPAAASVRAGIRAVRFNVRGDKFVTGDARGNIHLFHVLQNRYSLVCRAGSCPTAMQASPSPNAIVAIAFDDGTIRIVDSESCNVVATLKGHRARVRRPGAVCSVERSAYIASGDEPVVPPDWAVPRQQFQGPCHHMGRS